MDRHREERLSRRRELYRVARETPEEGETRLLRWRDYMWRRWASRRANERLQQLQAKPYTTLKHSINAVSRPRLCPDRDGQLQVKCFLRLALMSSIIEIGIFDGFEVARKP